ncbi:hypothetical protein [Mastigocoleus testarum]|uniref:Acetyltransferase n=1 Tax=Mastigocoleus testarum BC008 TaxID=371196 RepID=A0A0V7ZZY5_9CYAN|nr:hypothetical protein [Mastigocoleus testarum]KST69878.1 acetyltransferase [Mastigocoleus testarum BC008]
MFVQQKSTNNLIEVLTLQDLYDPCRKEIMGQSHAGEEMQEPSSYLKSELIFPSGEELPLCWLDPHYREVKSGKNAMSI